MNDLLCKRTDILLFYEQLWTFRYNKHWQLEWFTAICFIKWQVRNSHRPIYWRGCIFQHRSSTWWFDKYISNCILDMYLRWKQGTCTWGRSICTCTWDLCTCTWRQSTWYISATLVWECRLFLDIEVLQGSVATHKRVMWLLTITLLQIS